MTPADQIHGWTVRDINQLALFAASRYWSRITGPAERYAAAWSAAAEALATAQDPPGQDEMLRAARAGIVTLTQAHHRFHGLSQASGYTRTHGAFARYWYQPPLSGWEDAIVDRIALGQEWEGISPGHRRVLRALADCGDQESAARALGTSYVTYRSRLRQAREAFRELWYEGEAGEALPPVSVAVAATPAGRVGDYARLRGEGLNITEAGRRLGVCRRTASTYEAALIAAEAERAA